jgi:hypothetical protein
MVKMSAQRIYSLVQIKISLKYIQPPIWRRIVVPEEMTLYDLHQMIQGAFGWQDYHLHEFTINHVDYGDPENDEFGDHPILDETCYELSKLNLKKGSRFSYIYDFGDNWEHSLMIEKIIPTEKRYAKPRCIDGKRACPPEDVGSCAGYEEFLQILKDPQNEEYESTLVWAGGSFDPEEFDVDLANERIEQYVKKKLEWNPRQEYPLMGHHGWNEPQELLKTWKNQLTETDKKKIRNVSILRDVVSLLIYLRGHKTKGTLSTGNFPQRAVREIAGLFVNPPVLKHEYEGTTLEFKNEGDVWQVYYVHLLAYWVGLIDGAKGQVWGLTPKGEEFLQLSGVEQYYVMLTGWWFYGDWSDYPISPQYEKGVEYCFLNVIFDTLTECQPGNPVKFSAFIDRIIELSGYRPLQHDSEHYYQLCATIILAIIKSLEDFSVLSTQNAKNPGHYVSELLTIELTEIGNKILRTLRTS